jgi:hypothetical protein
MSKQASINEQLAALVAIMADNEDAILIEAAIEALRSRRLNKEQRATLEQAVEAWNPEGEDSKSRSLASQMAKYRSRYQRSVSASGDASLNNGDDMAVFLEGKNEIEVCELADKWTPIKDGQKHMLRYAKLNNGQKRMNAGNKLRAAAKKGAIAIDPKKGIVQGEAA